MKALLPIKMFFSLALLSIATCISAQSPEDVFNHEVLWSAYSGHSGIESVEAIYVDHGGSHYVVGYAPAAAPASWNVLNDYHGGIYDAFVSKADMDGHIIWTTWLGGSAGDFANCISTDADGNLIIAGFTSSDDIPESNVYPYPYHGGANDGFKFVVTTEGEILSAQYFGGGGSDYPSAIATDAMGNTYICGKSSSSGFDADFSLQQNNGGGMNDGFVLKLDRFGFESWYTFLGGTGADNISDLTITADNHVVIAGDGGYINVLNAVSPSDDLSTQSGFVCELNGEGMVEWVSYLNGSGSEMVNAVEMDPSTGNILVSGCFDGTSIGIFGIPVEGSGLDQDIVIGCLNPSGVPLWYNLVEGSGNEVPSDIGVDLFDNIYFTGTTSSSDLEVMDAFQETIGGGYDAVVGKLNPEGVITWLSFLGGTTDEFGGRFGTDRFGKITMVGNSYGTGLPNLVEGREYNALTDGFITRISDCDNPVVTLFALEDTIFCDGNEALMSACGASYYEWMNGDTTMMSTADTTMRAYVIGHNVVGCYGMSLYQQIESLEVPVVEIFTDGPTVFCGEQEVELYAIGPDTILWNNEMIGDMIVIDTAGVYSASGRGENGCVGSSDPLEIEFIELPDVDMAITDDTVCISDAPVPMISMPSDGFFVGPGTEVQGVFNPATAGGGTHTITYQWIDENGCTGTSEEVTVHVMYHPTVLFIAADTMCLNDPAIELTGSPVGGVFEGDGVVDNIFTPAQSGTGPQNIFYSYVDENGCTNVANSVIYVDACTFIPETAHEIDAIRVYPMPASDAITVETGNDDLTVCKIYDATGQLVLETSFRTKIQIDCSSFSQGFYNMECVNGVNISGIPFIVKR